MIYSFSPDAKLEWFFVVSYPSENKNSKKMRIPNAPGNKYEWSDGYVEGFPVGAEFSELVHFDIKSFINQNVGDFESKVNSDILQWDEQEIIRLELKREAAPFRFFYERKGKDWKPPERHCDRHEYFDLPNRRLVALRHRLSSVENKAIAEKCFQGKLPPSDLTLWLLSQLGYFRIKRTNSNRPIDQLNKSVENLEQLNAFLGSFSSLPKSLQSAEYLRSFCEKKLHIVFHSFSPVYFERGIIALLEATLSLFRDDSSLYGCRCLVDNGIDLESWIEARTVDLIKLCGGNLEKHSFVPRRYFEQHEALIKEFSKIEEILKEGGILSDENEASWYIDKGVELGREAIKCFDDLRREKRTSTLRRPLCFRDFEKCSIETPDDFRLDSAIASSRILANTFSISNIEELISYMAYAAITQGEILHKCPNCNLPFTKAVNRQTYCSIFCRVEHAKVPEGKKSPIKIRDNIQSKAWKKPGSQTEPKPFCVYFRCLIGALDRFWKQYQENDSIDAVTFNAWARALNCFKANHLEYDGNEIKCAYGKDNKGYKIKIDPLVPLIIDNQLVALSLKVENENTQQYVDKLCSAIDRYIAKGKSRGVTNCQKLEIIKECKKGNAKEELSSLIALGDEKELHRTMER